MIRMAFLVLVLGLSVQPAFAADITKQMVEDKNHELEGLMNGAKRQTLGFVRFLHDHISDDARFTLKVSDTTSGQQQPSVQMSKADYINSYINGTQFVSGYEMEINTVDVKAVPGTNEAITTDVMIERGRMINPASMETSGRPFVSTTTCETRQKLDADKMVVKGGNCRTVISYEESI